MSDEQNLAGLISDRKGTRSYEKVSQECGGTPTAKRLHQLANQPQKNFPDPDTIRGLAQGLGVTITEVVMASARTLGLPVYTGNDPTALAIGGAGVLDDESKETLSRVARQFIHLTSRATDGGPHGTARTEVPEPRPEASGTVDSSQGSGDRPRRSPPMNDGKVTALPSRDQAPEPDERPQRLAARHVKGGSKEKQRRRAETAPEDQSQGEGPEGGA